MITSAYQGAESTNGCIRGDDSAAASPFLGENRGSVRGRRLVEQRSMDMVVKDIN